MKGILIPLKNIIKESLYVFGQIKDLDCAFELIRCREVEIERIGTVSIEA